LGPLAAAGPQLRVTGDPPSGNGASSFHLGWQLPPVGEPIVEAGVTLTVTQPPVIDRLYFWALQVSFGDRGAGHIGLQWVTNPARAAVNWGGYGQGGRELDGSQSALPSRDGNPNTRDFPWQAAVPYRLRVYAVSPGGPGWRGSVTDLSTKTETVIRDLYCPADGLRDPIVWAEVFARCDDPLTEVRWSDPYVATVSGEVVRPRSVGVNYQRREDGGCDNTDSRVDGAAVVQVTNVTRTTPQGARLPLPGG
jgi:hypothetical protein